MATALDKVDLDGGATLPWSWYCDAEILRVERERIFRRTWQYVGWAGRAGDPGSYLAASAGGIPVVVCRDREGTLRGFLNVCRHRGAEIVSGDGRRETLQCPYHAWTYGLDGTLRAAPRAEAERGFDRASLSLRPVQVGVWEQFVFVNADLDAPPLQEALGALPRLVAASGVDVGGLRFHVRVPFALEANWKVACENFLECYHCPVAHQDFSRVVDVDPGRYRLQAEDLVMTQRSVIRGGGERCEFHLLWPNLKVNVFERPASLSIASMVPDGPARTIGWFDYFFAPDVPEGEIAEFLSFDDVVGREDAELVASVQRGMSSGLLEQGRLMPRSESLIAHWQRLTFDSLSGAL